MKVSQVMTKDVKSLSPNMSAKVALDVLLNIEISGLPVIDEGGRLVGMFTEKGVLKSILPTTAVPIFPIFLIYSCYTEFSKYRL